VPAGGLDLQPIRAKKTEALAGHRPPRAGAPRIQPSESPLTLARLSNLAHWSALGGGRCYTADVGGKVVGRGTHILPTINRAARRRILQKTRLGPAGSFFLVPAAKAGFYARDKVCLHTDSRAFRQNCSIRLGPGPRTLFPIGICPARGQEGQESSKPRQILECSFIRVWPADGAPLALLGAARANSGRSSWWGRGHKPFSTLRDSYRSIGNAPNSHRKTDFTNTRGAPSTRRRSPGLWSLPRVRERSEYARTLQVPSSAMYSRRDESTPQLIGAPHSILNSYVVRAARSPLGHSAVSLIRKPLRGCVTRGSLLTHLRTSFGPPEIRFR